MTTRSVLFGCRRLVSDAHGAAERLRDEGGHFDAVLTLTSAAEWIGRAADHIEKLNGALQPFAAMHREGSDPTELACSRGVASDMTALFSRDFATAAALLSPSERPAPENQP